MFIKQLNACTEIIANDGTRVYELLHPRQDPVELPYSLALAMLDAGQRSKVHYLRQTEVYYIIRGHGRMHVGDVDEPVSEGAAVVIPPEAPQWIENTGETELVFAAIVSPPWRAEDDVRI